MGAHRYANYELYHKSRQEASQLSDIQDFVNLIINEVVEIVDRRNGIEIATDEDIDRLFDDLD